MIVVQYDCRMPGNIKIGQNTFSARDDASGFVGRLVRQQFTGTITVFDYDESERVRECADCEPNIIATSWPGSAAGGDSAAE